MTMLEILSETREAEAIEAGKPVSFFLEIQSILGIATPELLDILRVSVSTWTRRSQDGNPLNFDATETGFRLKRVIRKSVELMGSEGPFWMVENHPLLEGHTPAQMCKSEPGGRLVMRILQNLESGSYS